MKINDNGTVRDITAEELAEMERIQAGMPELSRTSEERIADLEKALDLILSGVTQ